MPKKKVKESETTNNKENKETMRETTDLADKSAEKSLDMPLNATDIPETSAIRGIKYLSCQGGGMKGIGYVGAIRELDNLGVLSQLEEVSGSSAGGIFALMVAIGCNADELAEEMLSLDFRSFQDKQELGWIEASKIKQLVKNGADLLGTPGYLANFVSATEKGEELVRLMLGSELGLWEGDALTFFLANLVARKTGNPNITFRELAALGPPFKKLTLTGSNLTTGKVEYYNAENTPDMPIIQAARISASFPGAYKPVIVERKDAEGNPVKDEKGNIIKDTKVDGGLLENLPDVFNKPPYLSLEESKNGTQGNKHAFALSFTSEEEKPKEFNSIAALGIAMYDVKTSEGHLEKKYGDNIAFIDTVGMGTLDFEATEEKKQALVKSGAKSVSSAFKKILENEKGKSLDFKALDTEELIRIKVALKHKNNLTTTDERDSLIVIEELNRRVRKELSESELEELEEQAERRFLQRQAAAKKTLSDEELPKICAQKIKESREVERQLGENIERLERTKTALEFERDLIVKQFQEENSGLKIDLEALHELNVDIQGNLKEQARLVVKDNKSELKKVQEEYHTLVEGRREKYKSLIAEYENTNPILADLFKDLQKDIKNSGFKIPTSVRELFNYCNQDIQECEKYIQEAKKQLKSKIMETRLVGDYEQRFKERTVKSQHFEHLVDLNKELDKALREKTTVLTKMNHFLLKKAPKFEKSILRFSKVVSFLSFLCWLPAAIPVAGIAKLIAISPFSKPETKRTAKNVIGFFKLTDVESTYRLDALKKATVHSIKAMQDKYDVANEADIKKLHELHRDYSESIGIKTTQIFLRRPGETKKDYTSRINQINSKTESLLTKTQKHLSTSKVDTPKRVSENLEKFQQAVQIEVDRLKSKKTDLKTEEILERQAAVKHGAGKHHPQTLQTPEQQKQSRELILGFQQKRKAYFGKTHGKMKEISTTTKKPSKKPKQ